MAAGRHGWISVVVPRREPRRVRLDRFRRWPPIFAGICGLAACAPRPSAGEVGEAAAPDPAPVAAPAPAPGPAAEAPTPVPMASPPPDRPVLDPKIRAARDAAQARLLGRGEALQPDLPPRPAGPLPGADQPGPWPGFFAPLELPPYRANEAGPLAEFYAALDGISVGDRAGPVHVAVYGASGTAADLWTGYLRDYLQHRFGDGGPGLVAAAPPNRWFRHHEFKVQGSARGWTVHNAYRLEGEADPGHFGAMGQAVSSDRKGTWSEIVPKAGAPSAGAITWYEVHFLRQPRGGHFRVSLDGAPVGTYGTGLAPTGEAAGGAAQGGAPAAWDRVRVPITAAEPGPRGRRLRLEIVGDGPVRLLGVDSGNDGAGVVLDTLGVNGARLENLLVWDRALWSSHLGERAPALYLLAYGTNEAVDEDQPMEEFAALHRAALERLAGALPGASCVMIGPGDFLRVDPETGERSLRPRLDQIRAVQRELARDFDCAYLDTLAIAGGHFAKEAWVAAGLAKDDYLHLTRAGYLRLGLAVGDALLGPYDARDGAGNARPIDSP